jgi:hypothetical protein
MGKVFSLVLAIGVAVALTAIASHAGPPFAPAMGKGGPGGKGGLGSLIPGLGGDDRGPAALPGLGGKLPGSSGEPGKGMPGVPALGDRDLGDVKEKVLEGRGLPGVAKKLDGNDFKGPFFRSSDLSLFRNRLTPLTSLGTDVSGLPPGLQMYYAKHGQLPPGLQMQLDATGQLPPGLEMMRRGEILPGHIFRNLQPIDSSLIGGLGRTLPRNSRLYTHGRDALLVDYHSRRILDILRNVR